MMNDLLLLIDIDGTLLTTNGVAVNFMIQAAEEETGKKIKFEIIDYIGKLDPQIIETLLNKGEYSEQKIKERKNAVYNRYIQLLKPVLKKEDVTVYKGVRDFLKYIDSKELKYGLLTGNTAAGAKVKLSSVDFLKHFSFGAYGDDADNRAALVPIAISRAAEKYKTVFPDNKIWVIGDSPNDILCAKANNIKCCIVTTGRSDPKELKEMNPDILVNYLNEPEELFAEICRISDIC